jgi:hypothetical protein
MHLARTKVALQRQHHRLEFTRHCAVPSAQGPWLFVRPQLLPRLAASALCGLAFVYLT